MPNPPPCFLPPNLGNVSCYKSSPRGTGDCCLGGLTEGIIYNDAQNLKRDMDVRKGGEVHVCGNNFFEHFLTSASLNHD